MEESKSMLLWGRYVLLRATYMRGREYGARFPASRLDFLGFSWVVWEFSKPTTNLPLKTETIIPSLLRLPELAA
jgi:hypothetical protein